MAIINGRSPCAIYVRTVRSRYVSVKRIEHIDEVIQALDFIDEEGKIGKPDFHFTPPVQIALGALYLEECPQDNKINEILGFWSPALLHMRNRSSAEIGAYHHRIAWNPRMEDLYFAAVRKRASPKCNGP